MLFPRASTSTLRSSRLLMAVLLNLTFLSGDSYQIKGTFLKNSQGDIIIEVQHAPFERETRNAFTAFLNWGQQTSYNRPKLAGANLTSYEAQT